MITRSMMFRAAILVVGLLVICVAGRTTWSELRRPRLYEDEIQLLRRLAVSDDPSLGEVLDRSVVNIPAGYFLMGSNTERADEHPQRSV